ELLRGSDRQCIELMRMSREAYVRLCTHFIYKLWLHDSRHVSVEEKMAMFLTIIGHNERYVVIKRRFQHSSQTIHKYFHEVLAAMMTFAREMIVPSTFDPNPDNHGAHKSLRRIFAVGALDGTLVHAIIPSSQQTVYRGRGKGKCYQNVLGICDFNMIFTFVYAGWEGVAHDSRVFTEVMAASSNNFPFPPPSKYYLCDAAYTNTRGFMAPYRNVRYWLGDFRRRRAMTKEEKFNHAHAKLRNVIERAYGVLKARFPILDKMAPYPFNVQRNVVIACFAVNNFIRKEKINDELFAQYEEPQMVMEQVGQEEEVEFATTGSYWSAGDIQFMNNMREEIAVQLIGNI
ncbi:DDE_4 domain-containing protein, partial [Cephalotus follicularis]